MKKPEEIAKALHLCYNPPSSCDDCPYDDCEDCVATVAKDAEECIRALVDELPRWIPVEERLPDIGEVLISHCGYVCIAWHHGNGTFETGSRMMLVVGKHDITHWMPLPEPPQEV